jgi:DNA-binding response OmpR family regulator
MLSIVVIEDNEALLDVTVEALNEAGYSARGGSCAEQLDDALATAPIDLAVIDVNLPDESGYSLAQRLRAAHPLVGIIMVSARTRPADRIEGFRSGADVYLTKPTSAEELVSAVQAVERRIALTRGDGSWAAAPDQGEAGFVLDQRRLLIEHAGVSVPVSAGEASVISALARASGRRLEHWQLIEILAGDDEFSRTALSIRLTRLRKKLEMLGLGEGVLRPIRGYGYQLCRPARVL